MTDSVATVTISLTEYTELLEAERLLNHLQECGVDNWEGYSHPDEGEEEDEAT